MKPTFKNIDHSGVQTTIQLSEVVSDGLLQRNEYEADELKDISMWLGRIYSELCSRKDPVINITIPEIKIPDIKLPEVNLPELRPQVHFNPTITSEEKIVDVFTDMKLPWALLSVLLISSFSALLLGLFLLSKFIGL